MKRILLLCTAALTALACEKNNEEPNPDPIAYSISVNGGTASVDGEEVEEAVENTEITLTPNTLPGNDFVEWQSEDVEIDGNTFTMPAHSVTIAAVFENTTFAIVVNGGTASVDGNVTNVASEGDEVTLTPGTPPIVGGEFIEWQSEDVEIDGNIFTMPAHSVTVEASWRHQVAELVATGYVEVTFAASPGNAPKDVRWVNDDFANIKQFSPSGIKTVPAYGGFAEVVFLKESKTVHKFLLRDGDKVTISYDSNGKPQVTSTIDPGFDVVYNFPASMPGMPLGSLDDLLYDKRRKQQMGIGTLPANVVAAFNTYFAGFRAAVDGSAMSEEYKKYYKEAYFGSDGETVYDEELIRYYSINEGIKVYVDKLMMDLRRTSGGLGAAFDDAVAGEFDDIAADTDIPGLTKVVLLRNIMNMSTSLIDLGLEIEYRVKYTDLSGEDLLDEYKPYTGAQPEIDITLEDNQGRPFSMEQLIEDNAGKVIFVDFWATWCEPCMQSMPVSAKLRAMYPNVTFLYLSVDDDRAAWIETEDELGLHDSYRVTNRSSSSFVANSLGGLTSVPRYLVFDREGNMVYDRAPIPSGLLGMLFERY